MAQPAKPLLHTEYIDPAGLQLAQEHLRRARELSGLTPRQLRRASRLQHYLQSVDRTYSRMLLRPDGPGALPLRSLQCSYWFGCAGPWGRLYCTANKGPLDEDGRPTYVCVQGMPKQLRYYLLGRFARDLDIANCHPTLLLHLARTYHTWEENAGASALQMPALTRLCEERDDVYTSIADFHFLQERVPGWRRERVKDLFVRLLNGGSYDAWRAEVKFSGKRARFVGELQREVQRLRDAVLASEKFSWMVRREMWQQQQKGKEGERMKWGTFSKVAQHLEHTVLMAMRDHLMREQWLVLSLVFDGLVVYDRPDRAVDTAAIEAAVLAATGFAVAVVEKPLFGVRPDEDALLL